MVAWDPSDYLKFADQRLRPALDLLARIDAHAPARVYDLGCGTGNVTRLLARRWPAAEITGIDSSPEMLAAAQGADEDGGVRWQLADLAAWAPPAPADLLFSNAALHWLDDHAGLFRRLVAALAPGGILAVQMPRNHAAPSHTCMAAAARPWWDRLSPLLRPSPVGDPAFYHDVLAPHAAALDIWETEYLQLLTGDDPVLRWTRSTALAPLAEALDGAARDAFLADYAARLRAAYPRRPDGTTLFPFRRLFIVARVRE